MSYNTRRQGLAISFPTQPQGNQFSDGGVGRGTSQVMYHQQQTPSPRSSAPVRSVPQQSQNTQGYSSGYSSQPSGYQSGGNQGYSSQQYQAQQQVVPPPPPPPMSVQQSPAPKPLHGILKTESSSPAQQNPIKVSSPAGAGEAGSDVDRSDEAGDEGKKRPPWMKKKPFGYKVNKVLKRRRQNARLRKLLQPKNAIMVLNELVTGVKFTFSDHLNALSQQMYQVSTEIEGEVYTGQALSKIMAKQICAENALKAILLEKISKSFVKMTPSGSEKGEESNEAGGMSDGEDTSDKNMDVEDDVPWKSLTSFAIYKLFVEWQNEGTPVPYMTHSKSGQEDRSPKPMRKVPENPTDRHPVMLLNHMRPGLQFVEVSRSGTPPDMTFTVEVLVDGKRYPGSGKNKKEAKKEAAKVALAAVLDIHYP